MTETVGATETETEIEIEIEMADVSSLAIGRSGLVTLSSHESGTVSLAKASAGRTDQSVGTGVALQSTADRSANASAAAVGVEAGAGARLGGLRGKASLKRRRIVSLWTSSGGR